MSDVCAHWQIKRPTKAYFREKKQIGVIERRVRKGRPRGDRKGRESGGGLVDIPSANSTEESIHLGTLITKGAGVLHFQLRCGGIKPFSSFVFVVSKRNALILLSLSIS